MGLFNSAFEWAIKGIILVFGMASVVSMIGV
jgi:hypothetical protein